MTWRSSSTITSSPETVCEVVDQRGDRAVGPGLPIRQEAARRVPHAGQDPGHGGDDVGPEGGGLVVGRLERDPRRGPLRPWAAIHWATSVVLPKPGGAETSVSLDMAPRPRRSSRRARSTALGRGSGVCSLVPRSSVTIPA